MPAELPGFYFDSEKNRYFPISSRPIPAPIPILSSPKAPSARRRRIHSLADCTSSVERSRQRHTVECSNIASTSRFDWSTTSVFGTQITALGAKGARRFMGDGRGWLYTSTPDSIPHTRDYWASSLNLHPGNEVSSICVSDRHWISTGFGPTAKLAIEELDVPNRTMLLTIKQLSDVRASSLHGTSFVMGGKGKAVHIQDISTTPGISLTTLDTSSDVFSLDHCGSIMLAGCRNGSVQLFDLRSPSKYRGNHLTTREREDGKSPVLFTKRIHEFQVLTSRMNGILETIDIRFPKSPNPTMSFEGHVNNVDHRLGTAIDPNQDFLFAAGDDNRIRCWSLRTAQPVQPDSVRSLSPEVAPDLLSTVFPGKVSVLQIVEEKDPKDGLCLWAGSDHYLYQFYLGQKKIRRL